MKKIWVNIAKTIRVRMVEFVLIMDTHIFANVLMDGAVKTASTKTTRIVKVSVKIIHATMVELA